MLNFPRNLGLYRSFGAQTSKESFFTKAQEPVALLSWKSQSSFLNAFPAACLGWLRYCSVLIKHNVRDRGAMAWRIEAMHHVE